MGPFSTTLQCKIPSGIGRQHRVAEASTHRLIPCQGPTGRQGTVAINSVQTQTGDKLPRTARYSGGSGQPGVAEHPSWETLSPHVTRYSGVRGALTAADGDDVL